MLEDADATLDADPFQTLCSNYVWSLVITPTNLTFDGIPPTVTLKTRNDSDPFEPYKDCAEENFTETVVFMDNMMPFEDMQLDYKANGATGGTLTAILLLKPMD